MSLVKCPECGNEFSDKATACPECGFPTSELVQYQKESLIKEHTKNKTCYKCGSVDIVSVESVDGKLLIVCNKCWAIQETIPLDPEMREKPKNAIECPYCHSTNTKKISGSSRVASFLTFGLASKKVGKQWHCNKCGSDF